MTTATTVPANIDDETRRALKQLALDNNTTVGKLVAYAILRVYDEKLAAIKNKLSKQQ